MPIVPGSIGRLPRSSSRMSSTHERGCVRPCHDPRTPRRPTDDDPLRRTPARSPDLDGPAIRSRRLRDRNDPGVFRAGPAQPWRRWRRSRRERAGRLPQVPRLRARPGGDRARDRADGASTRRRRCGHDPRRGQPGRPSAPVRQGHRRREPRRRPGHPGLDRSGPGRVPRRGGRYRKVDRRAAGRRRPARGPPDVRLHRDRPRPDRRAPSGLVHPAQEHDPGPARQRAAGTSAGPGRRDRAADRAAPRADHRQAPDAATDHGPEGVLRAGQVAAGVVDRRLSVAQEDPRGRAEGRLARGLPVAGDLSRAPRDDTGRAHPADARQVHRERRRAAPRGPEGTVA